MLRSRFSVCNQSHCKVDQSGSSYTQQCADEEGDPNQGCVDTEIVTDARAYAHDLAAALVQAKFLAGKSAAIFV